MYRACMGTIYGAYTYIYIYIYMRTYMGPSLSFLRGYVVDCRGLIKGDTRSIDHAHIYIYTHTHVYVYIYIYGNYTGIVWRFDGLRLGV